MCVGFSVESGDVLEIVGAECGIFLVGDRIVRMFPM